MTGESGRGSTEESGTSAFHTVGYNLLKNIGTPGWQISLRNYSQQYQQTARRVIGEDAAALDELDE